MHNILCLGSSSHPCIFSTTHNILVQKCKILTAVHSFFEYQSRQSTSVSSFLHCIFYHIPRSYYPQNVDQANWENNQVACETLFHWFFSFLFHIFLESTDNYPIINPPPLFASRIRLFVHSKPVEQEQGRTTSFYSSS